MNLVPQGDGSTCLGELNPKRREVVRTKVAHHPRLTEGRREALSSFQRILVSPLGDVAAVAELFFAGEIGVGDEFDRWTTGIIFGSRFPAGQQVIFHTQPLFQRALRIAPRAEEVKLAADLFSPALGGMRK